RTQAAEAFTKLAKLRIGRLGLTTQRSKLWLDRKELLQLFAHPARIIDFGEELGARLVEAGHFGVGSADLCGAFFVGRRESSRPFFHGLELLRRSLGDLEGAFETGDPLFHRAELCRTVGNRFEAAKVLRR